MRLRSSVGVAFALAFLVYGSEAWAAACSGGNCPAASLVVTGVVSPQAAGTVSSVTVEVRTSAGARATGYTGTIRFTSTDAQALLPANYTFKSSTASTPNCTTGCDQGIHTFTNGVVLKTAATQSVTATDTAKPTVTGSQTGIVVQAQAPSRLVVSGIASPRTAGTASSVTVEVKDAYGNRVTSYTGTISFSSSDPQAVLPVNYTFRPTAAGTDNGIHTFTNGVTLKTVGSHSVTATDTTNGSVAGSQSSIQVNPGSASALVVSGIPSPLSQNTAAPVTVEARDLYGNRATAYAGTVKFTSTDAQAVLPANYKFTTGTGLDNGIHTFTPGVTLKTLGTQSVTATDTVTASIQGAQTGIMVISSAATTLVVSGVSSPQVAGTTSSLRVEARDSAGGIATGYTGTVRISTTDAQATRPTDHTFTSSEAGVFTFTGLVLRTAATHEVTATDIVNASISGKQSGVVVTPAAATRLLVAAPPPGVTAGVPTESTVTAIDAYGNVAKSYGGTVHFTASDPQASLTPTDYQFVGTDLGSHRFSGLVTFRTAGTQSLTATDTVSATINGTASSIAVGPGPAASLIVGGVVAPLTAGTPSSFTVEAKDAFGNRATAYSGTVAFGTSDPQGTVPAPHPFTTGDGGFYPATAVLRTAGSQSLSAADTVNGAITGSLAGIAVNPASAVTLTLSGIPAVVTAGDSDAAAVTAYDPYNNVATGYVGTVHFSSSDLRASLPPDRAFLPGDLGRVTVTGVVLTTAGSQSVTAADTLTPSLRATQGISVAPGPASSLTVGGFPTTTTAGSAGALTVTAYDVYGNLATGYAGTVSFSSSDAQATLAPPTTFTSADAGSRSFSIALKTAGLQSVTASDGARSNSQSGISVIPGPAAQLVVSGVASPIPSGQPTSVTVEARDTWANRATGYAGTVSFRSTDAQASLPAPYAFSGSDAGIHVFSNAITFVTYGTQSVTVSDGTISGVQTGISVTDSVAPTWPAGSALSAVATSMSTAHLSWTAAADNVGVTAYRLYRNGTLDQTLSGSTLATDVGGLAVGVSTSFQLQAGDAAGNWSAGGPIASVTTTPPDPQLIAPPIDLTVSTTLASATSFLYTGPNAIQMGVAPGTIAPTRAAVVRGLVRDRASQPLPGVKISVLNHPEYGNTWSRADGRYDLAVNGGDRLTVKYDRSDLLPVQRPTTPVWQDYTPLSDVVMVPYDGLATILTSGSSQAQVARGSVSFDDIGSRQATVIVPPGTSATMVLPDGSTQSLSTFHFRATEATVGADGPRAMPGPLPAMSAYTYAVAFTADEAVAAGASHVQFSQPVYGYVENFLSFPVGMTMPNGSYDSVTGRWLPEGNGRVIQILSVTGGSAVVDTNGDGQPDDASTLAALEISNSELAVLASTYQAGQTLWRVPMLHFSWEDWNVGSGLPPGASPPEPPPYDSDPPIPDPACYLGCIVDVQNQALGENVSIVGTPYELNYHSDRVPGRRAAYRLNLTVPAARQLVLPPNTTVCLPNRHPECQPAAGNPIPVPATVTVRVAGKTYQTTNNLNAAIDWRFEWDGKDVYGRALQGEQDVTLTACYNYPGIGYGTPDQVVASFGQPSISGSLTAWRWVGEYTQVFDLCRSTSTRIGTWNVVPEALGGWTLSTHHVLDVPNKTIYRGNGGIQRVDDLNRYVVNLFAGGGSGAPVDGVPASSIGLSPGGGVLAAPDGSVYFSGLAFNSYIGRITPDGIFHRIAGRGPSDPKGSFAEGIPALQAGMNNPSALALGPDGSLYFADVGVIRRVSPDGSIHTVAGSAAPSGSVVTGYTPDGVQAVGVRISVIGGSIAVGPDGSVYFAEDINYRIRKVGPDGVLRTVAGSGPTGQYNLGAFSGDNGPATSARLNLPAGVTISPDGSFLVADSCNQRIRRITSNGVITTVAGTGGTVCYGYGFPYGGDGGLATQAVIAQVMSLAVSPEGDVYLSDMQNLRVRRFAIGGNIDTIAGNPTGTCTGADCPATQVSWGSTSGISFGPAGDIYLVANNRIYHLTSAQSAQQIGLSNITVSSRDASEVYVFDLSGRHLKTLDALTNAQTQLFGYDGAGKLVSITDRDSNVTTIQRDGQENPTAIVGPYGQQTSLALDSDGYLHTITNPNAEMVQLLYKPVVLADAHTGGLLSQYTDARNGSAFYQYDSDGFLTKNTEPDGSYHTYSRGGYLASTSVTRTSALGRTQVFGLSQSRNNDAQTRVTQGADGLTTTQRRNADHSGSITYPDGTMITTAGLADPRFGIQSAYTSRTAITTPSGLTRSELRSRSVTLSNPQDPLSLTSLIESATVNGRTSQRSYNASTRRMTLTSAAGRVTTVDYDALGHLVSIAPPGVQPLQLHYDARGRNDTLSQGARVTTLTYRSDGFLGSVLDPLQHATSFGYDLAGRPTSQTLPDLSAFGIGYDPNGNLILVTPPGRPDHAFAYTQADLEKDYTPPDVRQPRTTHTDYNLDQQVSNVSRPDGDFTTPTYDLAKGRLTALTTSRGTNTYGYSASTGQLTSVTTFDGVGLTYAYDGSLLKDITWSGPVSGNVHKTYDSSFRLQSESVTGGQSINFGYNNDDMVTSVGAMTITRDPGTGFVTGTTLGAVSESRTYDNYGAQQSYTVTASGTTLYSVNYGTRDVLGRIVNKTETIQSETNTYGYMYDANGRLTDVTKNGVATSHYEYDANGNRLVGPGITASPVYDAQDRLLSYGNCSYSYKPDGSLQTKTCSDSTVTYDYDAFGNLRHVTLPNGTNIDYLVDGQNRPIGKKVNGALVEGFLYRSRLQPAAWLNPDGSIKATFVYGLHPNVPEYMVQGGTTYRVITDQPGSVRLVVNTSTGTVAERIDYDEFGNVLSDTAAGMQPFGFAGGLRDLDTRLTRFGSRDYDPVTGRWMAKDPLRFGGGLTNLYAYVANDPLNLFDPDGLFNILFGGGATAAAPTGAEVAAGIVFNPGLFGQRADVGVFASVGPTVGVNISADVFIGFVKGEIKNVSGPSINQNISIGPVSISLFHDPDTGDVMGGTFGLGPGATPVGYSVAYDQTGTLTIRDLIKFFKSGCD